ncbi:hypothetical protein [Bifidobacterium sp.]|uniref:hypothetical protein n=1 Tax=Bifidobacterium sp. TaxID=41200 RepID=UPI0039EB4A6F
MGMAPIPNSGTKRVQWHRFALRAGAIVVALAALVALIELFAFNMGFWQTLSNKPETVSLGQTSQADSTGDESSDEAQSAPHAVSDRTALALGSGLRYSTADGTIHVTDATRSYMDITLDSVNVSYVKMNLTAQQSESANSSNFTVRVDSLSSKAATTARSTEGWKVSGTHTLNASVPRSLIMRVPATATHTDALRIWIQEPTGTSIHIGSVTINPRIGLSINPIRVILMLAICAATIALLPRSRLWSVPLDTTRNAQRWAIRIAIAAIAIVGACSTISSIATYQFEQFHNPGGYTYDYNQYAHLADALLHGRPWLDLEVPKAFAHAANPYDVGVREQLLNHGVTPIYWDYAFYDGHWYSYFGVIPAVLLYMPYQAATSLWTTGGLMLPTPAAMSILTALSMILAMLLVIRILKRYFSGISVGATLICIIVMLCASNMPYLSSSGMFYTIPFASSLVFTFMGLWLWLGSRKSGNERHTADPAVDASPLASTDPSATSLQSRLSYPHIIAGSFCMAANLGCRPTFILAALLAVPIFAGDAMRFLRARRRRLLAKTIAAGTVPAVIVFIPLLAYNYWRFGSLTDFGNDYQITVTNMTQYKAPLSTILPIIGYFFGLPPNFTNHFPWVDYAAVPLDSWQYAEPALSGLFFIAPVLLLMLALPFLSRRLHSRRLLWLGVCMFGLGIALLLFDAYKAGFAWRYMLDFSWLFSLVAIICIAEMLAPSSPLVESRQLSHRSIRFRLVQHAVIVLTALTIVMNVLGILLLWERNDPALSLSIAQWFIL